MFEKMSSQCKHELQEVIDTSKASFIKFLNENASVEHKSAKLCTYEVLSSYQLIQSVPSQYYILYVILLCLVLFSILVWVEEIVFFWKNFPSQTRRDRTIWLLGAFPMFSTLAFLALIVPRAGPLLDMVANSFFGSCLYSFGILMEDYMGGSRAMWLKMWPADKQISLRTVPVCCCCVCLPPAKFNRQNYERLKIMVMQVFIVRPIIMLIAAVLWADGVYQPGNSSLRNGFIYIATINIASTMTAVYGLVLTEKTLSEELEEKFSIAGKIKCVQLCLLSSVIPNFILNMLVAQNVIHCTPILTSKARGEVLTHMILIWLMALFQLLARYFFRRASDGTVGNKMSELQNITGSDNDDSDRAIG